MCKISENSYNPILESSQDRYTIAVTDSGPGGLSVMAELVKRLEAASPFKKADVVFCNSQPPLTLEQRRTLPNSWFAKAFNSALESIHAKIHPDIILIACNTYSFLYGKTPFSQSSPVPVMGIIETGTDAAYDFLREFPESRIIIFGTPITVTSGVYKHRLAEKGIAEERIISQACPELHIRIESEGYDHPVTVKAVEECVSESLEKLKDTGTVFGASLNCTHYGYAADIFNRAFHNKGADPEALINPNSAMADAFISRSGTSRYTDAEIRARVIYMQEPPEVQMRTIGTLLERISPSVAKAFRDTEVIPDFFQCDIDDCGSGSAKAAADVRSRT